MVSPRWRQLITRERDDLWLRDHRHHVFQGRRLNSLEYMGGSEHAEESLAVFGGGMNKVPNRDVSLDFFQLGRNVS